MGKVYVSEFQVTAMMVINESGYQPGVVSVNGIPYEDAFDSGTYEQDADGNWEKVEDATLPDGTEEELKKWLDACGLGWTMQNGHVVETSREMPVNPARIPGCVYEGEEDVTPPVKAATPVTTTKSAGVSKSAYAIGIGWKVKVDGIIATVVSKKLTTTGVEMLLADAADPDIQKTCNFDTYEVISK